MGRTEPGGVSRREMPNGDFVYLGLGSKPTSDAVLPDSTPVPNVAADHLGYRPGAPIAES